MHEAGWSAWHDERLSIPAYLQWLSLQAQGPADVWPARATINGVDVAGQQIYKATDPESFADVVSRLTNRQRNRADFRCLSFVSINYSTGVMTRRTLAQAIASDAGIPAQKDGGDYYPDSVIDLRRGAWIRSMLPRTTI